MILKILTKNPSQTKKIGKFLADESLRSVVKRKKALILALVGDLGGGKTTFLQGFGKGLGIKERILSPTFVILKKIKIHANLRSNSCGFAYFYHLDCYRIQKPKEIQEIGFKEIISNPQNIVAIEWAGKIKKTLPKNIIWIKFEFRGEKKRKIILDVS